MSSELVQAQLTPTKKCLRCQLDRPITCYGKQTRTGKLYNQCEQCRRLVPAYGIDYSDFLRMYAEQNGVCKICGKPETALKKSSYTQPKALAVDHDAVTGKVRGLLCQRCNTGIGNFHHDTDMLRLAIKYLEETA